MASTPIRSCKVSWPDCGSWGSRDRGGQLSVACVRSLPCGYPQLSALFPWPCHIVLAKLCTVRKCTDPRQAEVIGLFPSVTGDHFRPCSDPARGPVVSSVSRQNQGEVTVTEQPKSFKAESCSRRGRRQRGPLSPGSLGDGCTVFLAVG